MILLFLLFIGLVVYLVMRGTKTTPDVYRKESTPLDILKRRYARGEITKEEYDRMKKDLQV